MPTITEIRQQFPQYGDMSDGDLATALHKKFYSDLPREDFDRKIGFNKEKPSPPLAESAVDVAKQIPAGLVTGTEEIAAAPARMAALLGHGAQALGIGSPEAAQQQENLKALIAKNRGEGIANYLPQPQTPAGETARYISGFVPGAVGATPGSIAKSAAIGAAAGTGANIGSAAGPGGEILGGLAGGMAGIKASEALAGRAANAALPTKEALKDAGNARYEAVTAKGLETPLGPHETADIANALRGALDKSGLRASRADAVHNLIDDFQKNGRDFVDLQNLRKGLREEMTGGQGENKAAAFAALPMVEGAMNARAPSLLKEIKAADQDWSAARTAERLDKRVAKAELGNTAAFSGMNLGNKLRQNVRGMVESNREGFGLRPDERALAEQIVRGSRTQNLMRGASNALGGGGGIGMWAPFIGMGGAGAAGAYATGDATGAGLGAALSPFAGLALRGMYNRSVAKQTAQLDQMIRARSNLAANQLGTEAAKYLSNAQAGLLSGVYAMPATQGLLGQPAQQ